MSELTELYEKQGIKPFVCKLCGSEGYAEFPYQERGVCGPCVRSLAHSYVMRHAGEPDPMFCSREEYDAYYAGQVASRQYRKIPIPGHLRKAVLERDAYRCQQCGDHHDLHVDHIFPESRGGEATLDNLQCLCRPCNIRKGARI